MISDIASEATELPLVVAIAMVFILNLEGQKEKDF